MRVVRSLVILSLTCLPALPAHALSNEAELLAAGAVKLAPPALRERLVRGTQTGKVLTGGEIRVRSTADGRYSGNIVTASGANAGLFGKWWVDDNGRSCADSNYDSKPTCGQMYEVSGRYFVVYDGDGAKRAFERFFSE